MSKTVLSFGVATLDYISSISHFPRPNEEVRNESLTICGGGNCANTLVALSRLGVKTRIITQVGKDSIGDQIIASLKEENIDTADVRRTVRDSAFSQILVDQSSHTRTIIHRPGSYKKENLKFREGILEDVDLLYIDGTSLPGKKPLVQLASKRGIPVVVESENPECGSHLLWRYADIVISSEDFHKDYFRSRNYEKNLARIQKQGPEAAIVTLGERGSLLRAKDKTIHTPAYKTKVVDTTGAGDAFIGGFIFGYLHKWDYGTSLRFASKVASMKCSKPGTREGLPHKEEIRSYIKKLLKE